MHTQDVEVARLLLGYGADPSAEFCHSTPLIAAVQSGRTPLVQLLLDAGANVNQRNDQGMTAFEIAQQYRSDAMIRLLLKHGARPDTQKDNRSSRLPPAADTPVPNPCINPDLR
jgi:uncharacterized protein